MNKPPIFQHPELDGSSFYWEGDGSKNVGILLFHGFTATTVEVKSLAKMLNSLGYTVTGPLLPGHGNSPKNLNRVRYSDWINCAENEYEKLSIKFEKVLIIGESMGALLTLWLAGKHQQVSGIAVFAPALKIRGLWKSLLAWPFTEYMYKRNTDDSMPWQGLNVVPLKAAAELYLLQQRVKRVLNLVKCPTLVFQGKNDKTIDPIGSIMVLEKIKSIDKELIYLDDSRHVILLDVQLGLVKEMVLDFIKKF
jgi:carboxylesterase